MKRLAVIYPSSAPGHAAVTRVERERSEEFDFDKHPLTLGNLGAETDDLFDVSLYGVGEEVEEKSRQELEALVKGANVLDEIAEFLDSEEHGGPEDISNFVHRKLAELGRSVPA